MSKIFAFIYRKHDSSNWFIGQRKTPITIIDACCSSIPRSGHEWKVLTKSQNCREDRYTRVFDEQKFSVYYRQEYDTIEKLIEGHFIDIL